MVTFQMTDSTEERPERDVEFTVSKSASRLVLAKRGKNRKGGEEEEMSPFEET